MNLTADQLLSGTPTAGWLDVVRRPEHIGDPERDAAWQKAVEDWADRQDGRVVSGPEVVAHDDPLVVLAYAGRQVTKDPTLVIQRWVMVPK